MNLIGRDDSNCASRPETGSAQSFDDVRTSLHQLPDEAGPVILDHQHHGPLIYAVVPGTFPTIGISLDAPGRIERGLEAVWHILAKAQMVEVPHGGQNDLRCERERCHGRPRGNRAVVGTTGHTARRDSRKTSAALPSMRRVALPGPSLAVIPQQCSEYLANF